MRPGLSGFDALKLVTCVPSNKASTTPVFGPAPDALEMRWANLALSAFKSLIFFGASRYRCGLRRSVAQFG